jgi:cytochrome bd ubiquinol oxidase subunit I
VFGTGVYYLLKLMRNGPALPGTTPDGVADDVHGRPARHALPVA